MSHISPRQAVCILFSLTLLAVLAAAPAALGGRPGPASYEYKVTNFDYHATGQIDGGRLPGACAYGDAIWEGSVTTGPGELSELTHGGGELNIEETRSRGTIEATSRVESKFQASHYETTSCDETGAIATYTSTPCNESKESKLNATLEIQGKVGTNVKLNWGFFVEGGSLVPGGFSCVKPFDFPKGSGSDCTKKSRAAGLSTFTAREVKLHFKCVYTTRKPPPRSGYTSYGATTTATGTVTLKRTKQG
jgi:hypothetical protein